MKLLLLVIGVVLSMVAQSANENVVVNDQLVSKWILSSMSISFEKDSDLASLLSKNYSIGKVEHGWERLKACRDAGKSLDLNLAAAEHYLYARYRTSDDGDTNYRNLPRWYETVKRAATKVGLESELRSSGEPVSPPNKSVTGWGNKGVEQGLLDFEFRTGKEPYPKVYAHVAVLTFGIVYYAKYPDMLTSCDLSEPQLSPIPVTPISPTIHIMN